MDVPPLVDAFPGKRKVSCFQFGEIMNKAAINIFVEIFFFISLDKYLEVEFLNHMESIHLTL